MCYHQFVRNCMGRRRDLSRDQERVTLYIKVFFRTSLSARSEIVCACTKTRPLHKICRLGSWGRRSPMINWRTLCRSYKARKRTNMQQQRAYVGGHWSVCVGKWTRTGSVHHCTSLLCMVMMQHIIRVLILLTSIKIICYGINSAFILMFSTWTTKQLEHD
jgi:hypothetical protein